MTNLNKGINPLHFGSDPAIQKSAFDPGSLLVEATTVQEVRGIPSVSAVKLTINLLYYI